MIKIEELKEFVRGYNDDNDSVAHGIDYSIFEPYSEDYAVVLLSNGKFSWVDKDGKIFGHCFTWVSSFKDGRAFVVFGPGHCAQIDKNFNVLCIIPDDGYAAPFFGLLNHILSNK